MPRILAVIKPTDWKESGATMAMPKAWKSCQRHGSHAKGMEAMPKTFWPYQRHRGGAKGMITMR